VMVPKQCCGHIHGPVVYTQGLPAVVCALSLTRYIPSLGSGGKIVVLMSQQQYALTEAVQTQLQRVQVTASSLRAEWYEDHQTFRSLLDHPCASASD
jgi:hypothetical protein